jgi:putative transposase
VILDGYSRKVVGWALQRTLARSLAITALEQAIAKRQPPPGLVHHSDRGVQYASAEYIAMLEKQRMIPSMSRPGNPYDNASCESFMRTLKREEIYANSYGDLEDLRAHIEDFIECYYNRCRLHSALDYRPPQEFEQIAATAAPADGCPTASMSFFRHGEIYRWKKEQHNGEPVLPSSPPHPIDESPAGYPLAGCSPAEPASASPADYDLQGEQQA